LKAEEKLRRTAIPRFKTLARILQAGQDLPLPDDSFL
jgi:hypothetical protein